MPNIFQYSHVRNLLQGKPVKSNRELESTYVFYQTFFAEIEEKVNVSCKTLKEKLNDSNKAQALAIAKELAQLKALEKKDKKVDAFEAENEGNTLLMLAAENNAWFAVKSLVDYRDNVNAKNRHGQTALTIAVTHKAVECVEELLKCGANVKDLDETYEETIDLTRFAQRGDNTTYSLFQRILIEQERFFDKKEEGPKESVLKEIEKQALNAFNEMEKSISPYRNKR